ncbi:MAG: helix-turn-helix domain-containing protein [Sandaracinaceae bacterium]|nr:helix-turn-helix domain-containing protein [Sandaracinaceae bacterium]
MPSSPRAAPAFGRLLRHWRALRGLSQLQLALQVETTTRHLSYVENGKSRPGRDLVLRLGEALDVPLRARNDLLGAAGLAAEFPAHPLGDAALVPYRRAIQRVLDAMRPYPAFVVDGLFGLEDANETGRRMMPAATDGARPNLIDAFLAPGPSRASIVNFAEVAWSWHARFLRATTGLGASVELDALRARVEVYLRDVERPALDGAGDLVICPTFRIGDTTVRTIGMSMRFGPSRDVTLEELSVEVLQPRDEEAERFFEELAGIG